MTEGGYTPDYHLGSNPFKIWCLTPRETVTSEDGDVYDLSMLGYTGPATSEGKPPQKNIIEFGEMLLDHAECIYPESYRVVAADGRDSRKVYTYAVEHKIYLYDATDGPSIDPSSILDWLKERRHEAEDLVDRYQTIAEQSETEEERENAESVIEEYTEKKAALDTIIPRIILPHGENKKGLRAEHKEQKE